MIFLTLGNFKEFSFFHCEKEAKLKRFYEFILVLQPQLEEEKRGEIVKKIEEIIKAGAGELLKNEDLGKKKLAYPIKKAVEGLYSLLYFKSEISCLKEIERFCRLNENVLRHFILKRKESAMEVKNG
jgi:small subunit ribosomal protein S6